MTLKGKKRIRCPVCKGDGYEIGGDWDEHLTCGMCDGDGKVSMKLKMQWLRDHKNGVW